MKAWLTEHPMATTLGVVVVSFLLVAGVLAWRTPAPQDRFLAVTAQRFSYTPHIIHVSRGDRITLRLLSKDVHHGFYLDGYDLETNARPGQEGSLQFVADRTGRFSFRCSTTCGPFHPYMVGYLKVGPDYRLLGSLWLIGSLLGLAAVSLRTNHRPAASPPPTSAQEEKP